MYNKKDYTISFVASPKKGDRRSRRTDMLLQQSLIELMQEKNLQEITVTEITKRVDLNRTTFYLHYDNVDQLYKRLEENLYQQFVQLLKSDTNSENPIQYAVSSTGSKFSIPIIAIVCRAIKENPLLATTLVNSPNRQLLQRIYAAGYDSLIENLHEAYPDLPRYKVDYYYSFIVNGIVGMIETWILRECEEDVDLFIELLTDYTLTHLLHFEQQLQTGEYK